MGNYLRTTLFLIPIIIVLGCNNQEKDKIEKITPPSISQILQESDSINCWAVEWYDYYDLDTKFCNGAEAHYCGIALPTNDSIYRFSYPCEFYKAQKYFIHGRNLSIEGEGEKRYKIDHDTLWVQWRGPHDYYDDTTEYINVYIYTRMKFESKELLTLLQQGTIIGCDTSNLTSEKCIQRWPHHDELVSDFRVEYKEF